MGLPAKRRTKSSKKRRASHFALGRITLSACASCKRPVLPHHLCMHCGAYQGRTLLSTHAKKAERIMRRREKAHKQETQQRDTADAT